MSNACFRVWLGYGLLQPFDGLEAEEVRSVSNCSLENENLLEDQWWLLAVYISDEQNYQSGHVFRVYPFHVTKEKQNQGHS